MRKFWIIASDVYKKNVRSGSFLILILAPFLMGAFYYFVGQLATSTSVDAIGVYSEEKAVAEAFTKVKAGDYTYKVVTSKAQGEKRMSDGKLDALLEITVVEDTVKGKLYSESSVGQVTQLTIQQILSGMQTNTRGAKLGVTPEQVSELTAQAKLTTQKIAFDASGKMTTKTDHSNIQMIVTNVCAVILFVFIVTYANIIAQEIASEKGTRIMEVILSSTKAQTHYYGKLTGVLLVALTQMVVYGIMIGFGYHYFKDMELVKQFLGGVSLEQLFGTFLIFALIFVLLGILIYAVLAALCGSLVNKAEDTAKAIIPVTYLSMGAYFISLFIGMFDPNSIALRVTSYIPFFSSFAMPVRLANDTASVANAVVSVVILFVATIGLMVLSAGLYKSNVLIYNENGIIASLKQSFTLMVNEGKKSS